MNVLYELIATTTTIIIIIIIIIMMMIIIIIIIIIIITTTTTTTTTIIILIYIAQFDTNGILTALYWGQEDHHGHQTVRWRSSHMDY